MYINDRAERIINGSDCETKAGFYSTRKEEKKMSCAYYRTLCKKEDCHCDEHYPEESFEFYNEIREAQIKMNDMATSSYEKYPHLEERYCSICGGLLVANSMAYYEGFHFDSCL